MFDATPTRAIKHELLAMTPGTTQFARRLRTIAVALDAEQARLDLAVKEMGTHPGSARAELDESRGEHQGR